jgi:hydrogenase nickel incorporation protein HypA/HybF
LHELGITQSIIDIAERTAREQGASRIISVTVEIGALSGVVPEAVEFCFAACSKGTLLEASQLLIERIPGRGRCPDCGLELNIDQLTFACPSCDTLGLERLTGEELRIRELEVD